MFLATLLRGAIFPPKAEQQGSEIGYPLEPLRRRESTELDELPEGEQSTVPNPLANAPNATEPFVGIATAIASSHHPDSLFG